MAVQRPVSLFALRPSGRPKWVWASARKKRLAASGKPNALLAPIWGRKFRFSRNDSVVPVLSRFHRHPYFTSERCPTAEVCSPPVGGGDLVHQFQPCAVAGPAVCFQLTGRIVLQWDAFRRATLYENDNFFALGPGTQTDGAAGRIVPHTVGEQVVYRSAE